jgi:transmembrane sensor
MDWFLRLRESSADPATDAAFQQWLHCSPEHAKAWDAACRSWALLGEAMPRQQAGATTPDIIDFATARSRKRRTSLRLWATGTLLAAACIILALNAPSLLILFTADYTTGTAQTMTLTLDDGSIVEMAARSAIKTEMEGATRHVTLLAGQAFFDVAHDAKRPFIVDAGGMKVVVIGTAFDVSMTSEHASVALARGIVDVSATGGKADTELSPGQIARADRASGTLTVDSIDTAEIGAWRDGKLFVNDATIASVVATLQRYHPAWIRIPSGTLASQRVTGLYDLKDPDHALEALVEPFGGKVHRLSPYLRVLSLL